MATQIKLRRGTAAQWTESNPTLAAGEAGFETDTNQLKIGNGTDNWAALDYISADLTPYLLASSASTTYAPIASPDFTGTVDVRDNTDSVGGKIYIYDQNVSSASVQINSEGMYFPSNQSYFKASGVYHPLRASFDRGIEFENNYGIRFRDSTPTGYSTTLISDGTYGSNKNISLPDKSGTVYLYEDTLISIPAERTSAFTLGTLGTTNPVMYELNGTFTVSVPTNATNAYAIGTQINFLNVGTGVITFAAADSGTTTLNGTPGLKLRAQWSSATLIKRKIDTWVLVGDLAA